MLECIICKAHSHSEVKKRRMFGFIHREDCGMVNDDIPEWQKITLHGLMKEVIDNREKES